MSATEPAPRPRSAPRVSKSRFMAGAQCPLRLWYAVFEPDLAEEPDEEQQYVFDAGARVGALARERYAGGRLIEADHLHPADALAQTRAALAETPRRPLYEAAFERDGAFARPDVLAPAPRGAWDLVEVKSSTKPKDHFVLDLAFQAWLLRRAGVPLRRAGLLLLDSDYVYDGVRLDLEALFRFEGLTPIARRMEAQVAEMTETFQGVLRRKKAPTIDPGPHCRDPYPCPFHAHCTRDLTLPEHPIDELPRLSAPRREELVRLGCASIPEIPEGARLTDRQERVRRAVSDGAEWISPGLRSALGEPTRPVHYLDFETFMPAIPRYKGTRPYQALPFQWSLHTETRDGSLRHQEHLSAGGGDPRPELAERLVEALGDRGTICTYSGYEARILRELARDFPRLRRPLTALEQRCWDLKRAVEEHYYHPKFHGSYSIKQVLPALVPDSGYEGLEIQDGKTAAIRYETALESEDARAREGTFEALRRYCRQDTLAMVELRKALLRKAGRGR